MRFHKFLKLSLFFFYDDLLFAFSLTNNISNYKNIILNEKFGINYRKLVFYKNF